MKFSKLSAVILTSCAVAISAASCVKVDYSLGYSVIPEYEKFVTTTFSAPIDSVCVSFLDSLTAYNSSRVTIGAIRDSKYGLTRRTAAMAITPLSDTLDWGTNIRFRRFRVGFEKDTLSYRSEDQKHILQNIRVYALKHAIDSTFSYSNQLRISDFEGEPLASNGVSLYDGGDSLAFDLTEEYAKTFWAGNEGKTVIIDTANYDMDDFIQDHPGIFICTDDPVGNGGRLDFFNVSAGTDDYGYLNGAYAALSFRADYGTRTDVDTTFYFSLGASQTGVSGTTFYSFNCCEHESMGTSFGDPYLLPCRLDYKKPVFLAKDDISIEGGIGVKPVIEARHLRNIMKENIRKEVAKYGITDLETALLERDIIINKATIVLPFDMPADYTDMTFYPAVLNPTLRISGNGSVTYAGLTDASVSSENQGEIDRNTLCYKPDISHHMQQILSTKEDSTLIKENIWFLILANEIDDSSSSSTSSSTSDYYSQMAYLNYYNSMLGGYGGYGSYGGYGYGSYGGYGYNSYDNYYSYYMMQQMYSSMYNTSSESTTTVLDRDRYYNAVLKGPKKDAPLNEVPHIEITYSFLIPEK